MDFIKHFKNISSSSSSGIALFMVISSMSILMILAVEFSYIAQMNQSTSYLHLDHIQAYYGAKSFFKLSLLRLKAYQNLKKLLDKKNQNTPALSEDLLNTLWSIPLPYPLPTQLPGITKNTKQLLEKFNTASHLTGTIQSHVTSESSKLNLNTFLDSTDSSLSEPAEGKKTPLDTLADFFNQLLKQKKEQDPFFASQYQGYRLEDLMDQIQAWQDNTFVPRTRFLDSAPAKHGPFFHLSELLFLPAMDDTLYRLFSPHVGAHFSKNINLYTVSQTTFQALLPELSAQEITHFFSLRSSGEMTQKIQTVNDFYEYLSKNVQFFKNQNMSGEKAFSDFFQKKGIFFVTNETEFSILIKATVNRSQSTWVAFVSLNSTEASSSSPVAEKNDWNSFLDSLLEQLDEKKPIEDKTIGMTLNYLKIF